MSATPGAARYTFTAQWEDPHSKLIRTFNLMFFEEDSSVEVGMLFQEGKGGQGRDMRPLITTARRGAFPISQNPLSSTHTRCCWPRRNRCTLFPLLLYK